MKLGTHIAYTLLAAALFSCEEEEKIPQVDNSPTDTTFIVYMAGDNSLSGNVSDNIQSIQEGYARMGGNMNIVIFHDRTDTPPQLLHLVRYKDGTVTQQVIRNYEEVNSVDKGFMASVLTDIQSHYKTEKYILDLWSHGTAWIPDADATPHAPQWMGQDGDEKLDIKDLKEMLERVGTKYEFILFDACLMSSVEVAYELREWAKHIVASPIEVWEMGFPYADILPHLTGENAPIETAKCYAAFYDGAFNPSYNMSMTGAIAVIDCSALDALASKTKDMLAEATDIPDIINRNKVLKYDRSFNHYLYDLGDYMDYLCGDSLAAQWKKDLEKVIVYKYATPTFGDKYSGGRIELPTDRFSGIGCYVPNPAYINWNAYYRTLEWYEDVELLPI